MRSIREHKDSEKGAIALVLGNSPWRSDFPVEGWDGGPIIGCNAAYRDLDETLDYLVTMDEMMIQEIAEWLPHKMTRLVLSAKQRWIKSMGNKEFPANCYTAENEFEFHCLTGHFALRLAEYLGCSAIMMVGFSVDRSNIYAGTNSYKPGNYDTILPPGSHKGWMKDLRTVLAGIKTPIFWAAPSDAMFKLMTDARHDPAITGPGVKP